jgi:hypothetical protein
MAGLYLAVAGTATPLSPPSTYSLSAAGGIANRQLVNPQLTQSLPAFFVAGVIPWNLLLWLCNRGPTFNRQPTFDNRQSKNKKSPLTSGGKTAKLPVFNVFGPNRADC